MGLEWVVFAASIALDSSIIASLQSIVANSTCYLPTEHSVNTRHKLKMLTLQEIYTTTILGAALTALIAV